MAKGLKNNCSKNLNIILNKEIVEYISLTDMAKYRNQIEPFSKFKKDIIKELTTKILM